MMTQKIDIKAIEVEINNATMGELEDLRAACQKTLDDLRAGKLTMPFEEKTTICIMAVYTMVLAEAKLQNKGWLFKALRRLQLTVAVMNALGRASQKK